MTVTDFLTGVSNRRYFFENFAEYDAQATQSGESFALATFDIDDFKAINDTYGHTVGDIAIKEVDFILNEIINNKEKYQLSNEKYFNRDGLYGFYDDAERFAFFDRAVLDMLRQLDWQPDVIHCNDWQKHEHQVL